MPAMFFPQKVDLSRPHNTPARFPVKWPSPEDERRAAEDRARQAAQAAADAQVQAVQAKAEAAQAQALRDAAATDADRVRRELASERERMTEGRKQSRAAVTRARRLAGVAVVVALVAVAVLLYARPGAQEKPAATMPAPVEPVASEHAEPAPAPAGNAVQAAPPIIPPTAASGNATP